MTAVTDADRAKAAEVLGWSSADIACARQSDTNDAAVLDAIAAALAEAREEGRQSVGLGDFVVDECDEETPVPSTWHDAYGYGYLDCTLRKGHDGEHEHQESGRTWGAR